MSTVAQSVAYRGTLRSAAGSTTPRAKCDPDHTAQPFHSHDRPRCIDCGDESGPWVPTGGHCEHGVQTFRCLPCTEAVAQ